MPGHIPDVFKAFPQAAAGLLPGQLGHAMTTLGFALAAVALALGGAAGWWRDNVTPLFDSGWVLPALLVLALLAPVLLPVFLLAELAFLIPMAVWGSRALLLAGTLSSLAPTSPTPPTPTGTRCKP